MSNHAPFRIIRYKIMTENTHTHTLSHLVTGFAVNSVPRGNGWGKRKVKRSAQLKCWTKCSLVCRTRLNDGGWKLLKETCLRGKYRDQLPCKQTESGTAWSKVGCRYVWKASFPDITAVQSVSSLSGDSKTAHHSPAKQCTKHKTPRYGGGHTHSATLRREAWIVT